MVQEFYADYEDTLELQSQAFVLHWSMVVIQSLKRAHKELIIRFYSLLILNEN
jgi:hypothetical protein